MLRQRTIDRDLFVDQFRNVCCQRPNQIMILTSLCSPESLFEPKVAMRRLAKFPAKGDHIPRTLRKASAFRFLVSRLCRPVRFANDSPSALGRQGAAIRRFWFGHTGDLSKGFTPEPFSNLGERGSFRI
jgi:hypothetical protein